MEEQLPINDEKVTKKMTVKDLFSDRKKVLIGVGIVIVALLLTYFIVGIRVKESQKNTNSTNSEVNLTTPEATVYFDPANINLAPGQKKSVDIYIDTWSKEITGANIVVRYNPNVLSDVTLTQARDNTSPLSLAFENGSTETNTTNQTLRLPLQMALTTPPQKGRGKVATLSFVAKKSNITQTTITLDAQTALITRTPQKVIVLQTGALIVHYPVNGIFPTATPQPYK